MDEIAVDFRALEDGEASLRRAVEEIEAHLADLEHSVSQLLGTWSGDAARAYQQAQHDWDVAMEGMRQDLRDLHEFLVTAHGNHTSAVTTNHRIWAV